jgi:hypothetical protein
MKQQKLRKMSNEELILKENMLKIALSIFIVILVLLTAVLTFMITRNGINPLIAVPIILIGIYVSSKKDLKDLRTEINAR